MVERVCVRSVVATCSVRPVVLLGPQVMPPSPPCLEIEIRIRSPNRGSRAALDVEVFVCVGTGSILELLRMECSVVAPTCRRRHHVDTN